jgi:hypothetical protein
VADPLELDSSGFAGPVGLLQAIRKQPDLVVNALGSALAENRGLSAYLPKLANAVLGEDLLVPDGPGLGPEVEICRPIIGCQRALFDRELSYNGRERPPAGHPAWRIAGRAASQ